MKGRESGWGWMGMGGREEEGVARERSEGRERREERQRQEEGKWSGVWRHFVVDI